MTGYRELIDASSAEEEALIEAVQTVEDEIALETALINAPIAVEHTELQCQQQRSTGKRINFAIRASLLTAAFLYRI